MLLTLNFFPDFFLFRLFFHPTFSKFSNVRFFFVAGCLRVPKGCLRGARFARNFFEKSFNSYLELEPPQHSVTRRGDFLAGSARGEARRVARWVLLGVSSRALRAQKFCKNFSKNSEKFAKMHQIPPSSGEPGGGLTYFGASMIYCFA